MQDLDFMDAADKLHLMMIIMLYAPVYRKNAKGQLMSATAAVKSRLNQFNSGEWRELWHDAHEHPELNQLLKARRGAQSGQAAQHAKLACAKHYALNGQLRDAQQCLTDSGLLSFFEPGIQQKMHALFEDCADGGELIMDALGDIGDDDCWGFEISEMWVKR
jgi:hypothetical protein